MVASAVPFHFTTACGWKLPPVTDNTKGDEPAGTFDGETLATAGAGPRDVPLNELPEQPARMASDMKEITRRK